MKNSVNDSRRTDTNQRTDSRSKLLFAVATLFSLVLVIAAVQLNHVNAELAEQNFADSAKLSQLSNDLRYYDEVLTLAASMAAVAGPGNYEKWLTRYNSYAPLLETAIVEATIPATESVLKNLGDINDQLVALEIELFDALKKGDAQSAKALINGRQYLTLKDTYTNNLERLTEILQLESERVIKVVSERESSARIVRRGGLLIFVLLWVAFATNSRRMSRLLTEYTAQLDNRAHFDQLTGIANRRLFVKRLEECLEETRESASCGALLLVDLDNFKSINDNLGHPVGDKLLEQVALKLADICRPTDTVARLGGDEFAIIARGIQTQEHSSVLAKRLTKVLDEPIPINGHWLRVQASIGIAAYPLNGNTQHELLRKADLAL